MMKEEAERSYLFGSNALYIEELYENYLKDPNSVEENWKEYFDQLIKNSHSDIKDQPRLDIEKSFEKLAKFKKPNTASGNALKIQALQKQVDVLRLIAAYRILGSRKADLDPLKRFGQNDYPELNPVNRGMNSQDMVKKFSISSKFSQDQLLPLNEIIAKLETTYCRNIGIEYMHIINSEERRWVRDRFESELSTPHFNTETKKRILDEITSAETFERYLHTKFVGQKRFSLEGGESLIAGLDHLINKASLVGIEDIVIGMAHRGRLNVLVNILGKQPKDLFDEFEGISKIEFPSGDVKYHNGFTSDLKTEGGPVHVSLEFNPSHLEIVNPVVEGNVRARQRRRGKGGKQKVMPILIHGDSAFIGLGVNQATFTLSQTRGYSTGGTIHIVVNNQIGFTTSDQRDTRSSTYCTDIAKIIDAPIIHVNGDNPEALCYVLQIALDYRTKFEKDIVIDLVCYRKLGHNETDDPFLTQPMMYKKVAQHPGVRAIYADKLVQEGIYTKEETDQLISTYRQALDEGKHVEITELGNYQRVHSTNWEPYKNTHWTHPVDTFLSQNDIQSLTEQFTTIPEGFQIHRTVKKIIESRKEMGLGNQPIDWGMAETLAYASIVVKGHAVRLSGEDSGRGTFSHRHAVLHDQNREKWDQGTYIPLEYIAPDQGNFKVIDSILNEEAVLAYEYGFASSSPTKLVIWEAQFGDFANGAQVAIDQFITSGETKWGRLCGLTIILPHGYDGQGPEHSSGRLERWLQLCAEDNIQVVMLSEASQMFHVLRRQLFRPYRKPLVIFMSKKLLRYKDSLSHIDDFTEGSRFRNVIGDSAERKNNSVKKVVICAGQVYFDIKEARDKANLVEDIAIIRLEQLYPFPTEEILNELKKYTKTKKIIWAQEEPKNQGAWYQIRDAFEEILTDKQITCVARPSSAAPAVGYRSKHLKQLENLVTEAISLA